MYRGENLWCTILIYEWRYTIAIAIAPYYYYIFTGVVAYVVAVSKLCIYNALYKSTKKNLCNSFFPLSSYSPHQETR